MTAPGFITMAFGKDKYLRQAEALARSIKRNMPGHPVALVTDRADVDPIFDIVVPMGSFAAAGTVHKVDMYAYSPFDETLFIDSDCIVVRSFERELDEIRRYEFSPICGAFLRDGDRDLWLEDVGRAVRAVGGTSFPKFNGGVYFFRKGPVAAEVFRRSEEIRARAGAIGIRDFDRSGPGEETLIGLALSSMGIDELYSDAGRLMRTPLNSQGRVVADPFTGESGFIKEGVPVSPAIIHYCGEWAAHPTYLIAQRSLARGRPLSAPEKSLIRARSSLAALRARATRRLRRITGRPAIA